MLIDDAVIKLNILLSKTTKPAETMNPLTDPLVELSKNGSTDKYSRTFFSSIYQVILVIFVTGVALTGLIALAKALISPDGKGRNEAKSALIYKFILIVCFFVAVPLFGVLVSAIMAILK